MPKTKRVEEVVWAPEATEDILFLRHCINAIFAQMTLPSGKEVPTPPPGKRWRVHMSKNSVVRLVSEDKPPPAWPTQTAPP